MEMAPPQIGRALVVVVDDRVSHGEREDTTGPLVRELLEEARLVVESISTSFRPLAACGSAS